MIKGGTYWKKADPRFAETSVGIRKGTRESEFMVVGFVEKNVYYLFHLCKGCGVDHERMNEEAGLRNRLANWALCTFQ